MYNRLYMWIEERQEEIFGSFGKILFPHHGRSLS
jgi:hypothetical protein